MKIFNTIHTCSTNWVSTVGTSPRHAVKHAIMDACTDGPPCDAST